jgi:hypothetical protein
MTYQCAADYGPIKRGDQVLAVYAASIDLIWTRYGGRSLRSVVDVAMQGIIRFYPTSCYRQFAQTWRRSRTLDLEAVEACF